MIIRSILEYASEVCDNCGQINSESVQLEDARTRVVTGLPSFASIQSIYTETRWEK
jgi:hypothetical protein